MQFSLLVEANSNEHLEHVLRPYCSYGCVGDEHMAFDDREECWRREYEEGAGEMVYLPSGRLLPTWSEHFQDPGTLSVVPPEHLPRITVPYNILYETFEIFVSHWYGQVKRPFGLLYNPRAKWDDWWLGNGTGSSLLLRQSVGEAVLGDVAKRLHVGVASTPFSARKSEIAWDRMRKERVARFLRRYDATSRRFGCPQTETESTALDAEKLDILEGIEAGGGDEYTREGWIDCAGRDALTDAFLCRNGIWTQRGELLRSAPKNKRKVLSYDERFWQFIERVPESQRVFLVTCRVYQN